MERMRVWAIAGVALITLVGCSHAPISTSDAKEIPRERLFMPTAAQAGITAEVIFKRNRGVYGAGCPVLVMVNRKPLGQLLAGEKITAHLPAGEVMLAAQLDHVICTRETREVRVELRPGQARAFRFDSTMGAGLVFEETAF